MADGRLTSGNLTATYKQCRQYLQTNKLTIYSCTECKVWSNRILHFSCHQLPFQRRIFLLCCKLLTAKCSSRLAMLGGKLVSFSSKISMRFSSKCDRNNALKFIHLLSIVHSFKCQCSMYNFQLVSSKLSIVDVYGMWMVQKCLNKHNYYLIFINNF